MVREMPFFDSGEVFFFKVSEITVSAVFFQLHRPFYSTPKNSASEKMENVKDWGSKHQRLGVHSFLRRQKWQNLNT